MENKHECDHSCSSNCRREGCNCNCGEYHENEEEMAERIKTHEDKLWEEAQHMEHDKM